jgi:hypothetical protein
MDALAAGHDAAVQMIVRLSCACISTEPASRITIIKIWAVREGPNEQDSRGGGHK